MDAKVNKDEAHMMTDESRLYQNLTRKGFKHDIVVHSKRNGSGAKCIPKVSMDSGDW